MSDFSFTLTNSKLSEVPYVKVLPQVYSAQAVILNGTSHTL